jgi:hypothetical protein
LLRVSSSSVRVSARAQLLVAAELGPPANDVGVGVMDASPGLGELRLGAGDVGLGHFHRGLAPLAPGGRFLDRGLPPSSTASSSGTAGSAGGRPIPDRIPDVGRRTLDGAGDAGVDLGGLERLELPRLADGVRRTVRRSGPTTSTRATGGEDAARPLSEGEGRSQPAETTAIVMSFTQRRRADKRERKRFGHTRCG